MEDRFYGFQALYFPFSGIVIADNREEALRKICLDKGWKIQHLQDTIRFRPIRRSDINKKFLSVLLNRGIYYFK